MKFIIGLLLFSFLYANATVVFNGAVNGNDSLPSQSGHSGEFLTTDGSSPSWASTGGGGGTVTSVALTAPAFLSVAGSPVTTSGTLALTFSGTAIPIANGGTNGTTATSAFNNLAPAQATHSGEFLTTDGTNTSWAAASGGANTFLSNLTSPTAINKDFIFDTGTSAIIKTKNDTGVASQDIEIHSGDVTGANSGWVWIKTGTADTAGTGQLELLTGTPTAVGVDSGYWVAQTGDVLNGANSGAFQFQTGAATNGTTGGISLLTGAGSSGAATGDILLQNGATSGTRGNIQLDTTSVRVLGDGTNAIGLRFYEGNNGNYAAIKAPVLAADYTLTLPVDDGTANQFLQTNGSGVLTWASSSVASPLQITGSYSASTPRYSFADDTDTGMDDTGGNLYFVNGGAARFAIAGNIFVAAAVGSDMGTSGTPFGHDYSNIYLAAVGSAAAPSFTINGDADTGMYESAANTLDFSTGGTARFEMTSAGLFPFANTTYDIGSTTKVVNFVYNKGNVIHNGTIELASLTRFSGGSTVGGQSFLAEDFKIQATKDTAIFTQTAATTNKLVLATGDASSGSGLIAAKTGDNSGATGATGALSAATGDQTNASSAANSGAISLHTGSTISTVTDVRSGNMTFSTGNSTGTHSPGGDIQTGSITMLSGDAKNGFSGAIQISSGQSEEQSGDVTISSGEGLIDDTGFSGDLLLQSGVVSGGTSRAGHVKLQPGTNPDDSQFNGHVEISGHLVYDGVAPAVSACGTAASVDGFDGAGRITVGTTAGGTCTLTFHQNWTKAPVCVIIDETPAAAFLPATATTTDFTLVGISDGDVISYHCVGYN